jgi:hypothetical protein
VHSVRPDDRSSQPAARLACRPCDEKAKPQ